MSKKKSHHHKTGLVFEELEPRLLLSADPLAVAVDAGETSVHELVVDNNEDLPAIVQTQTEQTDVSVRNELVIIDSRAPNFQQLHNDLIKAQQQGRNVHVVILDAHRDGIEQINEALESFNKLDAVHIVSHGDDGQLQLGATQLNKTTLRDRASDISSWKGAFGEAGDMMIYGCSLAESEDGRELVDALGKLTATDVAASDDLTGNSLLGGDWELEYEAGEIETTIAFSDDVQQNWQGTLEGAAPAAEAEQTTTEEQQQQDQQTQAELEAEQAALKEEEQAAAKQDEGEQETAITQEQRQEIVIIDESVPDFQAFIDDLQANSDPSTSFEIVLLDNTSDGVERINEILSAYQDVDALHILSHSDDGAVKLGDTWLNADNLDQYSDSLSAWGNALDVNADLMIYGCNLAGSAQGEQFVAELAQITGADVAASDDNTGHALLNGDWELEYRHGDIETSVVVSEDLQASWSSVLVSFTVDTNADTADVNPGDGLAQDASGNTSLRAAIEEANALGGADTITIGAGTFTLSGVQLSISSDITITGAGADQTFIDGASLSRIFDITSGTVTISNLTITNGSLSGDRGAGVQIWNSATVELIDVVVSGNSTTGAVSTAQGGGIRNLGTLTMDNVRITGNHADGQGGGLFNQGTVIITSSLVDANTSGDMGAGIRNTGANADLTLTNVTISGNTGAADGAGISNSADAVLYNVTVTQNSSTGGAATGGGIAEAMTSASTIITNSIIQENSAAGGSPDADGTYESQGYNLIGDTSGNSGWLASDLVNTLATLGALADNGGFTMTHALLAGSRGIDEGTNTGAPTTDQRGYIETDATMDIGAYQYGAVAPDLSIGLEAHLTFDAGQGAQDASGNNLHGTLSGNASVDTASATNQIGDGKLTLDGTDDYVNLNAHAASFASYTEGTVSAWFNTSSSTQQMLFNLGDTAASSFASLQLLSSGSIQWWVSEGGSTTVDVSTTATFNDGNWHHVAVTVGSSGTSLWVDGVELTGGAVTYLNGSAASTNFYSDLSGVARAEVGAYELSGTMYDEFNGLIDDFRIYDRALTAGDIGELQNLWIYGTPGDDVIAGTAGNDQIDALGGNDTIDYSGAAGPVTVDLTANTAQNTGGSGIDTLLDFERVIGSSGNDTFQFGNPVNGATYHVDGNVGSNTIDLSGYASSAVTFGNGTLTVDMGSGQSFTIDYVNIDTIDFSDVSANVLTNDIALTNWSGDALFIDGDETFRLSLAGGGTTDWSFVRGSDTLTVTGTTGTSGATALAIEDLNGQDLVIDQITIASDLGSLTTDANLGTLTMTSDWSIGTVTINGGAGTLGLLDGHGKILTNMTINADVTTANVVENQVTLTINGNVGDFDLGKFPVGSVLVVNGNVGSFINSSSADIVGDLTVSGNLGTLTIGKLQADGSLTIGGNLDTWTATDIDSPVTIGGDVGTLSFSKINADINIAGDLDSATTNTVLSGATITANQVVGTLVFDVGGTDYGGTYVNPVVYVFDGATQTPSATLANDAPIFIDGAIGNWNFDEGSGDSVAESAVGISSATLGSTAGADANDPTWTTGKFGQALHFDGVNDYVEIADAPGIDISGPEFSASLWVKPDRGPGTEDMFFMKGDRQGIGNVNYYLSWKDTGKMTWAFKSDGGFEYIDMDVTLPTVDEWNHVAVVFDRPTVSIYINGTEYTSSVGTGGTSMDKDLVANDEPLWIGAGRDGGSIVTPGNYSAPFSGAIDELALFDRALTDAEVEAIRTSAPPVVTASAFSIDENSANNTVVGTVAANDPDVGDTLSYAITAGNTGGAFSIDASGQIKVANSAALDFETNPVFNLTIEATDDGSPNLSDSTSVTITLNNLSDAPTLVNNTGLTAAEGSTAVITNAQLGYVDGEQPAASIRYSVTASPANGQLELTTNPDVAITSFTQDDIDNSRVVYVHNGSETTSDGFVFTVDDGQDNYASGPSISGIGSLTNVTSGISQARAPDYSPDGSKIVFARNNDIYIMNADGTGQTAIAPAPGGDFQAVWSPDGSRIAFTSERDTNNEIYVIDADGTNETRITTNAASDSAPAWSPDSSKIAFTSDRDGDKEIWVMDADGTNLVQLTFNTAIDGGASWSPDGSKIVFQSTRDGGDYEIYVMDADGSNQTRLTSEVGIDALGDWSPDGSKLLFYSERDGDNEIYVMDADGSNQVRLTNDVGDDIEAEWSPDGSSILFSSDRDGDYDIYSASVIYENTFVITVTAANDSPTLTALDGNPTFIESGTPVVLDSDVTIFDAELSGLDNFAGATLTLERNGSANSDDVFSATGTLSALTESGNLVVGGTTIGTVTINSGGTLVLMFNSSATNVLINQAMQQIAYSNSSSVPPASVQIDWTFDDGNAGSQGSGGALQTVGSTTVNITNVAPVISATGAATVNEGEVFTLNLSTSDPIDTWTINWGDGTIDTIAGNLTSATHTYSVGGLTNNITVSATDATGTYYDSSLIIGNAASGTDGFLLMAGYDPSTGLADIAGAQILNTPTPSDLDWAADVIVGPNGDIYATGYQSGNVVRFDGSTGVFVEEFVTTTQPVSIAFGPDGNLYVASDLGHVKRFDGTTGAYIDDFLTLSFTPEEMTFGDDGNLYVGQYDPGRIYRFDGVTGAPIDGGAAFIDPEITGTLADDINHSEQFAFGPDGNIYVASLDDGKIQRYDGTTGAFIDTFATPGNLGTGWPDGPTGVAFGPDGQLYVTKVDRVERYDGTTGAYIDDYIPTGSGLNNPWFTTFTPNQQVAVIDVTSPTITSDGGGITASVNVAENSTTVTTVVATDPNLDPLTYSIGGGVDQALFDIDPGTGVLTFKNAPNFENPADSDTNNVYQVTVQVNDGNGGIDIQKISVTVTEVLELAVTNTNATGTGSLYEAIQNANANTGATDTITFNIPGAGPHVINLSAALPAITDTVIIDGTTDPDYAGDPIIQIDGSALGAGVNGLTFTSTSDGSEVRGLMITGFSQHGIQVNSGADGITISNNWIGTTGTGSVGDDNGNTGIYIQGTNTVVGGTGANDGNVITNNSNEGINVTGAGATGTVIQGNIIGLDPDGATGSGNADVGIALLSGAHNTTIGGNTAAERNIISNNFEGIEINSNNNTVQGNYIGTDITGTLDRGNRSDDGIELQNGATGNLIGGSGAGEGNLISGNAQHGIHINNADGNTVKGNLIGTDATGTLDLGNGLTGIFVTNGAGNNTIGGLTAADRNVIAGNGDDNIKIEATAASGNTIIGNYIGVNAAGTAVLGNGGSGIDIQADGNTVGGTAAGAGNIISGSLYNGVVVSGDNNTIQGNYIGTDVSGTVDLGNGRNGVWVNGGSNNLVGGTDAGAGNLIYGNERNGVLVSNGTPTGNTILGNSIYGNTWIGIDLSSTTNGDDVTANDANDADTGPNALQNYPAITQADISGTDLTLSGTLDTDGVSTQYRIEFYGNAAGTTDATNGEGRVYLGSTTVTTDGSGDASFSNVVLNGVTLVAGDFVTATATRITDPGQVGIDDQLAYGSTSEFAVNVVIASDNLAPTVVNQSTTVAEGATNVVLTSADLSSTDVDTNDATLIYTVGNVTNGSLTINGSAWAAGSNDSFTQQDIIDGNVLYTHDGTNTTTDSFSYAVADPTGNTLSGQTFSITVTAIDDDAPMAVNQSTTVSEGATNVVLTTADLSSTDVDTSDATLIYTVGNVTNGTLTINGSAWAAGSNETFTQQDIIDGNVLYSHDGSNTTSDSFSYTVEDPTGNTLAGQTFSITVTAIDDDAPTVVNQSTTVSEGATNVVLTTADLSSTDVDTADATLIYTVGDVTNGTLTINGSAWAAGSNDSFTQQDIIDGNVLYTHDGTNTTTDSFSYSVADPTGNTLSGQTFSITVTAVDDDAPTAVNQSTTVAEGATNVALTTTDLSSTDVDTNDASLIYTVGNVSNGTLTINGSAWVAGSNETFTQQDIIDGNVLYSHDGSNTTSDSFSYTVADPIGNTLVGQTFSITVTAVDDNAPTAVNQSTTVSEGATNVVLTTTDLSSTDVDTNDATLIYTVGNVTNGTLTINGSAWAAGSNETFTQQDIIDGNVLYSHDGSNTTTDSFSYSVADPTGNTLSGQTFSITVTAVDDNAPTVVNQSTTVAEGATNVALTTADLSATDVDTNDASLIYTVGNVSNGTLTINGSAWAAGSNETFTQQDIIDGNVLYTHDGTNTTTDSFSYAVADPSGNTLVGQTFSITVTAVDDNAPTVVNQSTTVSEGATNVVFTTTDLQSTDVDTADATLIYTVGNVTNGSLTINGSAWAAGSNDSFTQQDIIDGTVLYSHDGSNTTSDSFSYTVADPTGNTLSGQTFSITVTAIDDDAPMAVNQSTTVSEGATNVVLTTADLSSTDVDTADATLIYTVGDVTNGTLTINGSAWAAGSNDSFTQQDIIDGNVLYTHDGTNTTTDSFSYSVADPTGNTLVGQTFSITVTAVDDNAPTAVNQSTTVSEGATNVVFTTTDLQSTDVDTADATLIYTVGNVTNGSLTINGSAWAAGSNDSFTQQDIIDGTVLYSHDGSNTTSDSFSYSVADPTGNTLSGQTFSITVTAIDDDAPMAVNQSTTVSEGATNVVLTTADLSSTDVDTNDAALIYTVGNVTNGTLTINGSAWAAGSNDSFTQQDIIDGTVLYSHDGSNTTSDSFSYTVADPIGNTLAGQTFSITVTAVDDDAPTAVNQSTTVSEGATNVVFTTTDLQSTDVDTADNTLVYTVGNVINGSLTINGSAWAAGTNETFTQQDIIDGNVLYTHDGTNTTSDSFSYSVADPAGNTLAGQTFSITVTAVDDDAPTAINQSVTVAEGATNVVLTTTDLSSTDVDTADNTLVYTVGNVINGSLTINGSAWAAGTNETFTQQDIIDGNVLYSHDGSNTTSDSFSYSVADLTGNTLSGQTFSITVTAVDDNAPMAVNQSTTVAEGATNVVLTTADLSSTDVDTADATLIYTVGNVTNGSLTINGSAWAAGLNETFTQQDVIDGNVLYTHDGTNTSSDSFSYSVADPTGNTLAGQTFSITITAVDDDAPTAMNQSTTVAEGATNVVLTTTDLSSTDADTNDATLIYTVGNVSNGSLTINGSAWAAGLNETFTQQDIIDGNVLYTHDGTNTSSDSFSYSVADPTGNTLAGQTFSITVTAVDDDAPTAVNQSKTVAEGAANVVLTTTDLSSTDLDTADATLIYTVGNVTNGSLTINGSTWAAGTNETFTQQDIIDGNVRYSHDGSNTTSDSFSYSVADPTGNTLAAQIFSITVTAVNDVPVATANTVTTSEDNAFNFASTDFTYADTEGDTLVSATITNLNLAGGTLTHSGGIGATDGMTLTAAQLDTLMYTPAANANGSPLATFDFTVNDADVGVVAAQMTINVTSQPDAAVIGGIDTGVVTEDVDPDMNGLLEVSGALTIIDPDVGESSFNAGVFGGSYGVITLNAAGDWDYAANTSQPAIQGLAAGATLTDTITVSSVDGTTHDIVITIMGTNDAPVAGNDIANVNEAGSVIIDVAANDSDIDSPLDLNSIVITGLPVNGTVIVNGDGTVTYTHDGSETLVDSFSYTISDISGAISNTATVTLNVNPVNDAPAANDDAATVAEGNAVLIDLAANDNDADNALDLNSISIIGAPANGSLIVNGDGTVTYTHDGSNTTSDSFTYTIADITGAISNTATVNITVTAVNDVPTTSGIADITVNEDAASTGIDLNAAFDDADNLDSELTYSIVGNTNIGLFSVAGIDNTTGQLTLDYAANMNGSTQISVRAADPSGASIDTLFTVTVNPVNDDPVLQANTGMVASDTAPVTISSGELNVTDIDNTTSELIYTITALPVNGSLMLNGVAMAVNDTFTQADLDNNLMAYQSNGGAASDRFGFAVADSAGSTLGNNTFEISVLLQPADDESTTTTTETPASSEEETVVNENVTTETGEGGMVAGAGGYGGGFVPFGSTSTPPPPAPVLTIEKPSAAETDEPRHIETLEKIDIAAEVEEYEVSTFAAVQVESMEALWSAVDKMKEKIASSTAQESGQVELKVAAIESSGVVLSAGVVAWLMRSGALLSSLLSNIPMWKGYDPLPVLMYKDDEEEAKEEEFDEDKIPTSLDELKKLKELKAQRAKGIDVDSMFGSSTI